MSTERSTGGAVLAVVALLAALLVFATPAGVPVAADGVSSASDPWGPEGIREWFGVHVFGTEDGFEPVIVPEDEAQSSSLAYAPLVAAPAGPWPEGEAGIDAFIAAAGVPATWAPDGQTACPEEAQACTKQSWCEGNGCPLEPPTASIHLRADDPTLFPVITDVGASVLIHELGHAQQAYVFPSPDEMLRVLDEEGYGAFTGHDGSTVPAVEGHAECYTQALIQSSAYFADCPVEFKERAVALLLEKRP
ncbi:hypothetical protein C5B85_10510 [Pseudoclavibacter sp. AY1F1]|uniref:hypothetical protein n=1 Tax=Pseudoclavibacter sp. AY1F1 TaxID=2080583 RepID=UPI000CE8D391|nr:hypothetical protein [Pseudoclavibacter sp. AY1F1]PPF44557.1 hypothetical protein C5B85_10510 [Pseudoclavibacter sp. AY1F1]